MSAKPVLAQEAAGVEHDKEDQDLTEENAEEEDKGEGDAISTRYSDTRAVIIMSNI